MMAVRLAMSAVCSLAAGFAAARLDKRAPLISGTILLPLFIPVHYALWSKFPIWYHLTFLTSLPLPMICPWVDLQIASTTALPPFGSAAMMASPRPKARPIPPRAAC